ncbi:hypothetical protein LOK49_LG06G03166 [Camellia lanceoleosa]|uniref:Uncharacterized protein n=1 Tax=Camellia lanceoleosa TaxID=1840588 RepID=A0ACC0HBS8_9ERIC|nr:hypothetical protein LOK49_LG06G03166 [Camellia lanceoleosa]
MSWADKFRRLKAMANADTPDDALIARNNDAEGIGLCRTEHMATVSMSNKGVTVLPEIMVPHVGTPQA